MLGVLQRAFELVVGGAQASGRILAADLDADVGRMLVQIGDHHLADQVVEMLVLVDHRLHAGRERTDEAIGQEHAEEGADEGAADHATEDRGRLVDPGAIRHTALLTVEGGRDDICSLGQTAAAHDLCSSLRPHLKRHHLQANVGHYGIFNGKKWEREVYPVVRNMILAME